MFDLDPEILAALNAGALVERQFIWITAKSRDDGMPHASGFWSDIGPLTIDLDDVETGEQVTRKYQGGFGMISIGEIPMVQGIEVRQVQAKLSHINQEVIDLLRTYDLREAPVQMHWGLFDPSTRVLIRKPVSMFLGFMSYAPLKTPPPGENGELDVTLVTDTRRLTRSSASVASDEDQRRRVATDRYFRYRPDMGKRPIFWGTQREATVSGGGGIPKDNPYAPRPRISKE